MSRCKQLCRSLLAILATRIVQELSTTAVIEASIHCNVNEELTGVVEALDKLYRKCTDGQPAPDQNKALH